jgi:hypothetical protein
MLACITLLASSSQPPAMAAPAGRTAQVADMGELWAALKSAAPGSVIMLKPGSYPELRLNGLNFVQPITFAAADPGRKPVIAGLVLNSSKGVRFRDIKFSVNPKTGFAAMVGGSSDVRFDGVELFGAGPGDGNGLMFRNSSDVAVVNSLVHDVGTGINHLDSQRITICGNRLREIQSDGVRGGGSSFIQITQNEFTDFRPKAGDHPDAIQFWTRNTKGPARDLTISGNTFVRGKGAAVQGIFVGNENKIPYENVLISGNRIIGGMYHGISISDGTNIKIEKNVVQGYSDMTSWIMINGAVNSTLDSNVASDYKMSRNEKLKQVSNKGIKLAKIGDLGPAPVSAPRGCGPA